MQNDFIDTLRLQLTTDIQGLFTHGLSDPNPGYKEALVVHEFQDKPDSYPCVVVDIATGSSPSRHISRSDYDLVHIDFYPLAVRPNRPNDIRQCTDGDNRSGRMLVEYLALKLNNYLKTYVPDDAIIDYKVDLILNPDGREREGIFKTLVQYEFII